MKSQLVRSDVLDYSVCAVNCQIVRKFYVTLLKILHFNSGKFITLTVFNCERTAKKNSSLRFFVSLLLTVRVSIYTQLSVVITVKFTTQFSEKRLRSLSQQLYNSEFELPFWVITVLK